LNYPAHAIERQPAHAPRNEVRAPYNRAQYLRERRTVMQNSADLLDTVESGDTNVTAGRFGKAG
jgi:hypothetical protein